MILDFLQNDKRTIIGVVKDASGANSLDVSYNPEAITPDVLKAIRDMPDGIEVEDATREMLATFGLEWNMKNYTPAVPGRDSVEVTLPNGKTKSVQAGADGKALLVDVPSTVEGMRNVSLRVLDVILSAIQEDARGKAQTTTPSATG